MQARGSFQDDDEAVSPVIGVILVVAITVILAAVVGTFVLDLGGSIQDNVEAGVNIDEDPGEDRIAVTFTTNQDANHTEVRAVNDSGTANATYGLGVIGDSVTFTTAGADPSGNAVWLESDDGYAGHSEDDTVEVTVIGVDGDRRTVLNTRTVEL